MRKFLIILIVALSIFVCSCEPRMYSYECDDLKNNIANVQMINYNNQNAKSISKACDNFDLEKMEILEELDESRIEEFVISLSKIRFHVYNKHPDSAFGICIRIVYSDGTFEIMSCNSIDKDLYNFIGRYSPTGEAIEYVGSFAGKQVFQDILNKFFSIDLDTGTNSLNNCDTLFS